MFFYEAFNDLSASRPVSTGGPLPIPVSEVLAYCELFHIDDIDFRTTLFAHTRRLDAAYLKAVSAKPSSG